MEHTVGQILLALFDDQLWSNREELTKGFSELNAWTAASWSTGYNSASEAYINSSLDVDQAKKSLSPLIQQQVFQSIWVVQTGLCPLFTFVKQFKLIDVKFSQGYIIKPFEEAA